MSIPYQFHDFPSILLGYFVYTLVILVYAIWLRHLFGTRAQRFGWLLLAGQLLLLTMHGWPIGPHSWWNHDFEGNIPVAFATFQVLAGSFCALAIVLLASPHPRWLRGYWAMLSLGLYVLALDELGVLHDRFPIIEDFYLIGGGFVVLSSIEVWRNLDTGKRRYLYMLIAGLGISVAGAEILDKKPWFCAKHLQIFSLDCMRFHPLEESFEKLGAFFVVMSLLGLAVKSIPIERWRRVRRSLLLSFSIPTLVLLMIITIVNIRLGTFDPIIHNRTFFHHTDFANGYRLDATIFPQVETLHSGQNLFVTIYGETHDDIEQDFGYAIHFVDQVDEAVYSAHEHWSRYTAEQWRQEKNFGDQQKLWISENVPAGRALWLVFSLWQQNEDGDFVTIPISSSDQFLLSDTQIVLRDFILSEPALDFSFGESFILRDTGIPPSVRAGETLVISFTWEAATWHVCQ